MSARNVLAIDGGGVRGLLPAMLLAEIEERTGKPAHETFDVIAGTSTGAFIGSLLCASDDGRKPLAAEEAVELFRQHAGEYFRKRRFGGWFRPRFRHRPVERLLERIFGEATLGKAATRLLIPVYTLRQNVPRIHYFTSLLAAESAGHDFRLRDVVRGATAAPTAFPPYTLTSLDGSNTLTAVDGGVFANNPADIGWVHAHQTPGDASKTVRFDEQFTVQRDNLANTRVVSIGTGFANTPINAKAARRWGQIGWILPLINIMFEAQAAQADAQLRIAKSTEQVLEYDRLQPLLPHPIDLGDVKAIDELMEICRAYIDTPDVQTELDRIAAYLQPEA